MKEQSDKFIVWFSCGAASAVAAYMTIKEYGKENVKVVYSDTLKYEHPDNLRFLKDVEKWLGIEIEIIKSEKYNDIYEVFYDKKFLVGRRYAPCTEELKIKTRLLYQRQYMDYIQVFGFTSEEGKRFMKFALHNENVEMEWILGEKNISKDNCFAIINEAGIKLPEMYYLGFPNANCIGCVKAANLAYWGKIKELDEKAQNGDESLYMFKGIYNKMAKLERFIGRTINKDQRGGKITRIFLDEMTEEDFERGRDLKMPNTECGVTCTPVEDQGGLFDD